MPAAFDERREAQARAYDRSQALLFLLRFVSPVLILIVMLKGLQVF